MKLGPLEIAGERIPATENHTTHAHNTETGFRRPNPLARPRSVAPPRSHDAEPRSHKPSCNLSRSYTRTTRFLAHPSHHNSRTFDEIAHNPRRLRTKLSNTFAHNSTRLRTARDNSSHQTLEQNPGTPAHLSHQHRRREGGGESLRESERERERSERERD